MKFVDDETTFPVNYSISLVSGVGDTRCLLLVMPNRQRRSVLYRLY